MISFRLVPPTWRILASLTLVIPLALACNGIEPMNVSETPVSPRPTSSPSKTHPTIAPVIKTPDPTDRPIQTATPLPSPLLWEGPLLIKNRSHSSRDTSSPIPLPVFDLGTNQQKLFPQQLITGDVDVWGWTPDGCSLLVSSANYAQKIYAINIVTQETTVLPVPASNPMQYLMPYLMRYSPDGKWIAYSTRFSGLYLVRADGSEIIPLANRNELNYFFRSWTSDSQKVLFRASHNNVGTNKVRESYTVDIHLREVCLVARIPQPLERWEDLYLAKTTDCQQIKLPYPGPVEGANYVRVVYSSNSRYMIVLLAENLEIAYEGVRLFLLDTKTGTMHALQDKEFSLSGMGWSSDGDTFAFTASYASEQDQQAPHLLHLVDTLTGVVQILEIEGGTNPSWSPDDSLLALQLKSESAIIYNLDTKEILYLPDVFNARSRLLWSPRMVYGPGACQDNTKEPASP